LKSFFKEVYRFFLYLKKRHTAKERWRKA